MLQMYIIKSTVSHLPITMYLHSPISTRSWGEGGTQVIGVVIEMAVAFNLEPNCTKIYKA